MALFNRWHISIQYSNGAVKQKRSNRFLGSILGVGMSHRSFSFLKAGRWNFLFDISRYRQGESCLRNAGILQRLALAMDEHSHARKRASDDPCQSGACECHAWVRFRSRLPDVDPFITRSQLNNHKGKYMQINGFRKWKNSPFRSRMIFYHALYV